MDRYPDQHLHQAQPIHCAWTRSHFGRDRGGSRDGWIDAWAAAVCKAAILGGVCLFSGLGVQRHRRGRACMEQLGACVFEAGRASSICRLGCGRARRARRRASSNGRRAGSARANVWAVAGMFPAGVFVVQCWYPLSMEAWKRLVPLQSSA
jgi:hypothetical protein